MRILLTVNKRISFYLKNLLGEGLLEDTQASATVLNKYVERWERKKRR